MHHFRRCGVLLVLVWGAAGCTASGRWYTPEPAAPSVVAMPMDVEAAKAQWDWGMPAQRVTDDVRWAAPSII